MSSDFPGRVGVSPASLPAGETPARPWNSESKHKHPTFPWSHAPCAWQTVVEFINDPFLEKGVLNYDFLNEWYLMMTQKSILSRCQFRILAMLVFLLIFTGRFALPAQSRETSEGTVRTEMPYRDGTVILTSDSQEKIASLHRATGHVEFVFRDIIVSGEEAEYNEETGEGSLKGSVRFSQKQQWLTCSRAEFNLSDGTGVFYDATGYLDREFLITSRTIRKTGADTYRIEKLDITACKQKPPKWSFGTSLADIRINQETREPQTIRLHSTVFKIKGLPVFYFPYLIVPMEKKTRSGGFVPFHTGTSTSKGRLISEGYYQPLGRSADLMIYGDYFSLRGLAVGGIFRVTPNPETNFKIEAYGINDKLGQGGVQLMVNGETRLKDDWRAVARVNITSNFVFRQAFSDNFRYATIPQELATAFLTRNHDSTSINIAFEREEVLFPLHSLVIRKIPSLEFISIGTPLGRLPLILSYRASLDGLSRTDSFMETQGLIQRLDFYPRLTLRLPSFEGFSFMPSIGVRETYYSSHMSTDSTASGIVNQALHRRYADLNIEMKTPVLQRDFSSSLLGNFIHTVEPFAAYRWIHGIKDPYRIIRFDEEDAIADTNELEYGIMNRFFRNRKTDDGMQGKYEILSFGLAQKYYLDPTFGGAFRPNQFNAFYPMDTLTGLYQTAIPRRFSPISAIFQLSPRNGIHNDIQADFDTGLMRWRNGSITTEWQQGRFSLSGTYLGIHALEPGMPTGNHVQGQIVYGSHERGLVSSITVNYNLRTNQLLNSNTRISYKWDCCGLGIDFNQFDLGLRTESRFSFSFTLKGIGSFGNMKRPESYF
jgi:LPS-assembly protein